MVTKGEVGIPGTPPSGTTLFRSHFGSIRSSSPFCLRFRASMDAANLWEVLQGHVIAGHAGATSICRILMSKHGSDYERIAALQAKAGSAMHLPVAQAAAAIAARWKALEWMATYVGLAHSKLWRAKLLDTTPWIKKIRGGAAQAGTDNTI